MKLYSYQGQEPKELPHKIRLSDGRSRTDSSSFTEEEIIDAGFTGPYEIPDFNSEHQRLFWDPNNLSYIIEDISDEELWDKVREKRNRLLLESDWTMSLDVPGDNINLKEWMKYRQRLRDITTQDSNPKLIVWPLSPDENDNFDVEPVFELRARFRIEDLEANLKTSLEKIKDLETEINNLSEIIKNNSTSSQGG